MPPNDERRPGETGSGADDAVVYDTPPVVAFASDDARAQWDADDEHRRLHALRIARFRALELSQNPDELDAILAGDEAVIQAVLDGEQDAPVADASGGIDAADLLALELPDLQWIVPDLIPEGATVIASPPKIGKSCLVYQLCVEVAIGGELLGRTVEQGSALYLALEDGRRRGQQRLRAALEGRSLPRGRLEVRWGAKKIGEGLEQDLAAWLDGHPDARLVAIDTLQRVRPRTAGNRNAYEVDVEDLARLHNVVRDRGVALVIVHHSRKEAGDDFLASVSGTYGITGSVDTTVVIRRKRLEAFGTILVTGRDVADAEVAVRFDGLTWHEAPAALSEASFERTEVYRLMEELGPIWPKPMADKLDLSRTSVQNMVTKLYDAGAVTRTTHGYVVVGDHSLARARVTNVPDDSDDSVRGRESLESPGTRVGELDTISSRYFASIGEEPE